MFSRYLALPLWLVGVFTTATVSAVPSDAATQPTHYAPSAFNATAYNSLVDCVRNVSTKYHVAVEEGMVVIIPPENDSIDVDGADAALIDCIAAASRYLRTAIDGDRDTILSGSPSMPLNQATASWAETHGAEGLTAMAPDAILTTSNAPSLNERSVSYYYALGDDEDRGCVNYDSKAYVFNECVGFNPGYVSLKFQNVDLHLNMVTSYWPHHLCAVDYNSQGRRTITVPPASVSSCQNRDTFSWKSRQVTCGGVC